MIVLSVMRGIWDRPGRQRISTQAGRFAFHREIERGPVAGVQVGLLV